ncbi:MAG: phosphatidylserine/phosphatidylglycerophosphate/cardiolipin synthase family protein [Kofleriaceae bacterium]
MTAPGAAARLDESTSLLAAIGRYTRSLYRLRRGNTLTLLRSGGEAFPAMLAAIAAARASVVLETYILEDDRTGQRFADALCARAAAGVAVRVLYDAVGGLGLSGAYLARLRAAGVEVVQFHPLAPWRARFDWSHRDHRKILVVDDAVGFAGGLNISDDYAPLADGGLGWHDLHCEVRGPVVRDLARLFRATWLAAGGTPYPAPPRADAPDAPRVGATAVRVVDNRKIRRRGAIRRSYLRAIEASRTSVHLANAYFLPDRGLRRALMRAARRGVDVAVIVPGRSDVRTVAYAGLYVYHRLAKAGVRILRWDGPMMHAKSAVVDGVWAAIGSYNLDARSLRYNLEVIVEAVDGDVGATMEAQWFADHLHTTPFTAADWDRLAWWRRALAWLAFRLRRWL